MKRTAAAEWKGNLKDGAGVVSSGSGTLKGVRYGFRDRFEDGSGTNPEELIAAAHAGCFSMALSAELGNAGLTPDSIRTQASLNFEKRDAGWTITSIHLDVAGQVPGADEAAFAKAAAAAKAGCPISRLLRAEITMSAHLEKVTSNR